MMRVVYLCEHGTLLGGERSLLVFLQHARRTLEPMVVCPKDGPLAERARELSLAVDAWEGNPKEPSTLQALAWKWMDRGIDVVHANSLSLAAHAINLGTRWNCARVFHARDIYRLSARQWEILRAGADAAIAVSEPVAEFLRQGGMEGAKVHVIANGVERPAAEKQKFVTDEMTRPVVACVGQIALRKGQDVFVEAALQLMGEGFAGTFLVVGERYSRKEESASYERMLRERTSAYGNQFVWTGSIRDAAEEMIGFDLLVIASRQEPLARVALEALSAGVKVVATDVGGSASILDKGRLGWLIPAGDARALARAIKEALADNEKGAYVRNAGPAWMEENYSPARQVAALKRVYEEVIRR